MYTDFSVSQRPLKDKGKKTIPLALFSKFMQAGISGRFQYYPSFQSYEQREKPLYLPATNPLSMRLKPAVLLPLIFISTFANAQLKKGNRMVGATVGSIFFNSGSSDISFPLPGLDYTSNTTSFGASIAPTMGWFISDRTAVGVTVNINPTKSKTTLESSSGNTFQRDETRDFNLGIGGFARNYFASGSSFRPFGQAALNIGLTSKKTEGMYIAPGNLYKTTFDGKSSGGLFTNATLSFGMTKLLGPQVGLDFFAGYSFSFANTEMKTTTLRDDGNNGSVDFTSIDDRETKTTNHGFMIGVGLQVFLQK